MTSYSDMQRAAWCKRSWWLGSYRGLRPKNQPRSGPLPFGSRIHLALEVARKTDRWDRDEIGSLWNELMDVEFDKNKMLDLHRDPELTRESKMGHAMLTNFITWWEETGQDTKWEVVGIESKYGEYIPVKLPDGRTVQMLFRGKLDLWERRRSDGALAIVDYKTAQNLAEVTIGAQILSEQGPLYSKLVSLDQPDADIWGVSYIMLRKVQHTKTSNPPYYTRLDVPISVKRLEAVMTNLGGKAAQVVLMTEALDAGQNPLSVAPYNVGWWCNKCPFKNPCRLMQDGNLTGARDMLRDRYEVGDIWQRYADEEEVVNALQT